MRSYSIALAPSDSKLIELAIERLACGEVSPFLHDLAQVGDTIEPRGPPGGHFLCPEPSKIAVLMIGAVPLIAMIRYRKAGGVPIPVVLLLSYRTWRDAPLRAELLELERSLPDFVLALALSASRRRATATLASGSTQGWSLKSRRGCLCPRLHLRVRVERLRRYRGGRGAHFGAASEGDKNGTLWRLSDDPSPFARGWFSQTPDFPMGSAAMVIPAQRDVSLKETAASRMLSMTIDAQRLERVLP